MAIARNLSEELTEAVRKAREEGVSVSVLGSGSKTFLVESVEPASEGRLLSTVEHCGVIEYRPEELVITARAGTPLKEIAQLLARERQMLPFEPPQFRGQGTLGGAVACGLAGPGRPWRGSVRDSVLGVVMVNGRAERLKFGGQVVKNVAGFDLSRLQAGAYGALGLLLDISVRVVPQPPMEATRSLEMGGDDALAHMRRWARLPLPITATCYLDGRLLVRLSGPQSAVLAAQSRIGGEAPAETAIWERLRDQELPLFRSAQPLLLRTPAPSAPLQETDRLIEWSGARRWGSRSEGAAIEPMQGARVFGAGYAGRVWQPKDPVAGRYHQRLKQAFDPDNLFNPELCRADIAA